MPYLGIFGPEFLKAAPSNLSNCKILQEKQKCRNLGPKFMPYLLRCLI